MIAKGFNREEREGEGRISNIEYRTPNIEVGEGKGKGKGKMEKGRYDLEDRLIRFAVTALDIADSLPRHTGYAHIAGQIARSGTSPAPNYAEAQSAESRKDFIHKLKIGLKELRETSVWLKIIQYKQMHSDTSTLKNGLDECDELIRIFVKCIQTARSNDEREM